MAIVVQRGIPELLVGPVAIAISLFLLSFALCAVILFAIGADWDAVLRKTAQASIPSVVAPVPHGGSLARRKRKQKRKATCFVLGGDCDLGELAGDVEGGPFDLDDSLWLEPPSPQEMAEHFIGDAQPLGSRAEAGRGGPVEDVYDLDNSVWRLPVTTA